MFYFSREFVDEVAEVRRIAQWVEQRIQFKFVKVPMRQLGKELREFILLLLGRFFRRERLDDVFEARLAAERIP